MPYIQSILLGKRLLIILSWAEGNHLFQLSILKIANSFTQPTLVQVFYFRFYPDKNGNISFVAEAGQKSEAGMTGFPVTERCH